MNCLKVLMTVYVLSVCISSRLGLRLSIYLNVIILFILCVRPSGLNDLCSVPDVSDLLGKMNLINIEHYKNENLMYLKT